MNAQRFPIGTPVCVRQTIERRDQSTFAEVIGVVEAWEDRPTGSWFAHGKDARLWLQRLKLRKADGEIVLLIIDDSTEIAELKSAPS